MAEQPFFTIVTVVKTLPNPFSSVNFYATDDGGNDADADNVQLTTQLRLIASVPAVRADVKTNAVAMGGDRVWTYEKTVSADEYYAIVDGDEEYNGSILAIGVNYRDENGAALASGAVDLNLDERDER